MNRLQKKCVIATVGIHLLLLLILVFGSAFFAPRPKPDDTQLLEVIPANLVDAAFNSGVKDATPPPPAPVVVPQPPTPTPAVQTPPQPPPPTPKPVDPPTPTLAERVKEIFKPDPKPEPVKPATPKPPESQTHQITINTQRVARVAPKNPTPNSKPDNSQAIASALRNLKTHLSPGTTIDMPGDSTVAYANYASAVKSVYERALASFLPNTIANNDENTKVSVTIASDGTVITSSIISRSGDSVWDAAVQHTLDRVTFIKPFPAGATDIERHYTINFNPQVERSLK